MTSKKPLESSTQSKRLDGWKEGAWHLMDAIDGVS
jgi:hypothetical protein